MEHEETRPPAPLGLPDQIGGDQMVVRIQVAAGDNEIPGGKNVLTAGPDGGMEMSRARPSGNGTFHHTSSKAGSSGAGYTGEQT